MPREYSDLNGRWTVVFGKRINNKVVYKKDGQKTYLLFNDCGQFQMTKDVVGSCKGFGINNKGVWTFDGKENPDTKVKPVRADDPPDPEMTEAAQEKLRKQVERELQEAGEQEKLKMQREQEVVTFRGRMDEEDEAVGDRLMKKFGAKIAKGF
mmetsp:Transcript_56709/g.112757  ORF Transcript_56709/g.112757 Transcript_56709/m.112757 type:complete len:153 (+) Transcript_56709:2-460(+)